MRFEKWPHYAVLALAIGHQAGVVGGLAGLQLDDRPQAMCADAGETTGVNASPALGQPGQHFLAEAGDVLPVAFGPAAAPLLATNIGLAGLNHFACAASRASGSRE